MAVSAEEACDSMQERLEQREQEQREAFREFEERIDQELMSAMHWPYSVSPFPEEWTKYAKQLYEAQGWDVKIGAGGAVVASYYLTFTPVPKSRPPGGLG